ncbi:MAG: cyclic GMP-AMP synthase DncV-like nucleotidyltransferase [Verrucomicrobiota bacterium]
MKDCNRDVTNYHRDRVILNPGQRKQLRERRNANRDRLKKGLKKNGDPSPDEFIIQGSYAAKTTIQEPANAYDIDDGAAFSKDALLGPQGGEKSALDAKKMVRDAVDDGSFKTPPEVKTNCVRVHYNDGTHVDIPVYRKSIGPDGANYYEIASSDWKESNPKGVNDWFSGCLARHSGDGKDQMREVIRLVKGYCKHRPGHSLPSGFALTVLVDEAYGGFETRLDRVFRNVVTAIRDRLRSSLAVKHPVVEEHLADEGDTKCAKLRELLSSSMEQLAKLDRGNCKRSDALKVWKKVFNTDYFDSAIEDALQEEKNAAAAAVASVTVMPKPFAPLGHQ